MLSCQVILGGTVSFVTCQVFSTRGAYPPVSLPCKNTMAWLSPSCLDFHNMLCFCRMLKSVLAQESARTTLGTPSNRQGVHASGRQLQAEMSSGDSSHSDDESHRSDSSDSDSSSCSSSDGSGDEAGALKLHLLIGHLLLMTTSGAAAWVCE